MIRAFEAKAKALLIAVTATASASTALPSSGNTIRLVNTGTKNCYVAIGESAQVATVPSGTANGTSTPVLAGTDITLTIPTTATQNISAICDGADTTNLVVQVGDGI